MALIVETGQGGADSEAYASVADADAYHAARGATLWAPLLDAEKEQALRRATEFMTELYRLRWAGYRMSETQALDWPRYDVPRRDTGSGYGGLRGVYPTDTVPAEVRNACCALAFKAAQGDLAPDLGPQKQSVTVGPITTTYATGTRQSTFHRSIELMLAPLLKSSGANMRVSRA